MYLKVFVTPGAKREVIKEEKERWLISVREPAERNLANDRVRAVVAGRLGVPLAKVRILTGHRSRGKMISVA
jgi:uncharacterized protein YggU (UPF0235/DUF167 family)